MYADIHIEADTEDEAIALYNRGHYKDSQYFMDDFFYNYEFDSISEMEADSKIFLNLLQFITITFTVIYALYYCILCYQFISCSTSKFFIFTSKCS